MKQNQEISKERIIKTKEILKKELETREINEIDFCGCLFGYFKLNNCIKFDVFALAHFIYGKITTNENLRVKFANINFESVILEGVSSFEIMGAVKRDIFSRNKEVKLILPREEAYKLTKSVPGEIRVIIETIALDFLFPNRTFLDPKYMLMRKGAKTC